MENLVSLVHSNNILTRPLGVNVAKKVLRQRNVRLYVLLVMLWLDSIYTTLLSFIPTEQEELLMSMGDLAFMIFNKNRYFFSSVVLFYRISSAAMVTCFVRNDFSWIVEAGEIFDRLKSAQLWYTLIRLRRRCRVVVVLVVLGRVAVIVSAHTMGALLNAQRDAKYFLVHSYLYTGYYALMYSCVNFQFMIELYFLCKICIALFDEINGKFCQGVLMGQYDRFPVYYYQFSEACLLVHRVMSYVRPTYIIYFVCNLIVTIFLIFVGIFASDNPISSALFLTFAFGEASVVVFFSSVIGTIDVKASEISDLIYRLYILDIAHNPRAKQFKSMIQRYFHSTWCSTIGLVVLGNHINASSSIRVLTIVLTVMAFLISNFRQSHID